MDMSIRMFIFLVMLGVSNLFEASSEDSGVEIKQSIYKVQISDIEGSMNLSKCLFSDMLQFYLEKLNLKNLVKTIDVYYMRDSNYNILGLTKEVTGGYQVILNDKLSLVDLRVTLAHELIHVKQLEEGRVDKVEFGKYYHKRVFEEEAFSHSIRLAIDFYTKMKC